MKIFSLFIAVLLLLTGCAPKNGLDNGYSSSADAVAGIELDKKISDDTDQNRFDARIIFSEINGKKMTLEQVNDLFPVEFLRRTDDNKYYCVYKTQNNGRVYLFFTGLDFMTEQYFYVERPLSYSDFKNLKEGDSIAQVESIDPAAGIFKTAFGNAQSPFNISYHYLTDGIVEIRYNYLDSQYFIERLNYYSDYVVGGGYSDGSGIKLKVNNDDLL